jgi:galactose-1-phosphate uridylyltransferase
MKLSDEQISDLARPLGEILEKFYADPKNEEDFQKWLKAEYATETGS